MYRIYIEIPREASNFGLAVKSTVQRRRERKADREIPQIQVPQNSKAESTQPTRTEKVKGSGTDIISGQNVLILQSIEGGAREPNGIRKEKEEKEGREGKEGKEREN